MRNKDIEKFNNVLEYICLDLKEPLNALPSKYKTK